jgi:hypothetical protein
MCSRRSHLEVCPKEKLTSRKIKITPQMDKKIGFFDIFSK